MIKGLIGIFVFTVAISIALLVNNWAKKKGTRAPHWQWGWFAFGMVCFFAIIIIKILDKLGWYPD